MAHFLDISDHSPIALKELLRTAISLKRELKNGGNRPLLAGKVLAMIFEKPSLRTRVSFDVAMLQLGGHALYLSPNEIGLGKRETTADIARVLSGYTQGIMARVFAHQHLVDLSKWSSIPVINGLSEKSHPCQALADMLTIYEHFATMSGLKIAYVGDSNNVALSLAEICLLLGSAVVIASPTHYQFDAATIEAIRALGGDFTITDDPIKAVSGAHVVYTDTWTSMGQEQESEIRRQVFPPYQINHELLRYADQKAVVLHCLPAHRGEEITDDVADGHQSLLFAQAENRLHAQKAVLVKLMANPS